MQMGADLNFVKKVIYSNFSWYTFLPNLADLEVDFCCLHVNCLMKYTHSIGGSKGDARDARPLSGSNIFQYHAVFGGKIVIILKIAFIFCLIGEVCQIYFSWKNPIDVCNRESLCLPMAGGTFLFLSSVFVMVRWGGWLRDGWRTSWSCSSWSVSSFRLFFGGVKHPEK